MTVGVNGSTMDGMGMERIEKIIVSLRNHSYQPEPAKRIYIEKKNSVKKRPLGIQSADDKLVQEIIRMILESMYETNFSEQSHGFRPQKSCHTALKQIKDTASGTKWAVEGDIKACYDSFNHHVLIDILRKRINDEAFINLMWKFLKAGYMEQWEYNRTQTGVPQGSGASPILANIYLNEIDRYMEETKKSFDRGKGRSPNHEYTKIYREYEAQKKKYTNDWDKLNSVQKKEAKKNLIRLRKQYMKLPSKRPIDKGYRRLHYCRYADDFLICIIGSKKDAEEIRNKVRGMLRDRLILELSEIKTLITHSSEMIRFLGYDIGLHRKPKSRYTKEGEYRRYGENTVNLYIPKEKWVNKLIENKALQIGKNGDGKETWKPKHRGELMNKSCEEIIRKYDSEIRGIYNFYCLANNVSVLNKFKYIMEYSMYKTIAGKYKTTVRKIISKYSKDGKFGIKYQTKSGAKVATLYDGGFRKKNKPLNWNTDILSQYAKYNTRNSVIGRLKAGVCQICGDTKGKYIQMHQVKKLKDLKGNKLWEKLMIANRRKTLAICAKCHQMLHEGILD